MALAAAELTLYWTEPRLPSGDFAPEDPLAIDYVGQQLGNDLWPGFTTRTTRAAYYVMVCYGLRLCEDVALRHGLPIDDDTIRRLFERWERLWAFAVVASYGGDVPRGESIRGQRGATRAVRAARGGARASLAYRLLSRQLELGALGAYLTSLRAHRLVQRDRLRLTPLGAALADWMWADDGSHDGSDDAFAAAHVAPPQDPADPIHGRVGRTTLQSFGERCRLARVRERPPLQRLLADRLVLDHPPPPELAPLPEMAAHLRGAVAEGVASVRGFLLGVRDGRWRAPSDAVRRHAAIAIAFGDVSACLRAAFDRAYAHVEGGGMQGGRDDVAAAAFPAAVRSALAAGLAAWRAAPETALRLARLPVHGAAFAAAVRALDPDRPTTCLAAVVDLHLRIQRDRAKSGGWLRRDGDLVLLEVGGYRSWSLDPEVWVVGYKVNEMASLLDDLGLLS